MNIFVDNKIDTLRDLLEYMREIPYIKENHKIDIKIENNEEFPCQMKIDKLMERVAQLDYITQAFETAAKTLDSSELRIIEYAKKKLTFNEKCKLERLGYAAIRNKERIIFSILKQEIQNNGIDIYSSEDEMNI